ncbi:hypothetical protein F4778DRAFT_378444 [Xylariomycetidae sp. FL2044]|nr:hypothetical protein F4778DRAFT_378444 [Xylariomycetidae sp. FL2044]
MHWCHLLGGLSALLVRPSIASAESADTGVDLRHLFTDVRLQWSPNTTVVFPDDNEEFVARTQRWTIFQPPAYTVVISPGTETDVMQAVELARSNNLSFLATGGRHGYTTTLGALQGGVAIDLSQLRSVDVNASTATMTVGGGVLFSDIMDPLYDAGFEIQIGSCSCPGMVGVTLGAGVGRMSGIHGLLIDSLISARVVTAEGDLVEVSSTSHPDLFWAIRGAGANFGIITSATYQVHELTNGGQIMNVDLIFPANTSSAYFSLLESYGESLPPELATVSIINFDSTANQTQLLVNWVYMGPESEGREIIAPLLDLGPTVANISIVPWNKLIATVGFGIDPTICQKDVIRVVYGINLRQLSSATYDAVFQKMAVFYDSYPDAQQSAIEMEIFPNQAAVAIPVDETAYPWRDSIGYILINFLWIVENDTLTEAVRNLGDELRQEFVETSGYPELRVYVNYAYGDESAEQMYGQDNLPRLTALKSTWDPDNVFRYNNPLPLSY